MQPTGTQKSDGAGLERLWLQVCASRGTPAERIVAIGDNHNDHSMISMAGCGVAMGNAESEVKAIARLVVADNDHDGIAEAIATLWP